MRIWMLASAGVLDDSNMERWRFHWLCRNLWASCVTSSTVASRTDDWVDGLSCANYANWHTSLHVYKLVTFSGRKAVTVRLPEARKRISSAATIQNRPTHSKLKSFFQILLICQDIPSFKWIKMVGCLFIPKVRSGRSRCYYPSKDALSRTRRQTNARKSFAR